MSAGARIPVRLTPRGGREEVRLREDGSLAVRVAAPPVDGRANEALERAVANALGIAAGRVRVERGARSRDKLLRIDGLDAAEVRARLEARGGGARHEWPFPKNEKDH